MARVCFNATMDEEDIRELRDDYELDDETARQAAELIEFGLDEEAIEIADNN
jgi:hypothetical protein